jgi:hypothetical protein
MRSLLSYIFHPDLSASASNPRLRPRFDGLRFRRWVFASRRPGSRSWPPYVWSDACGRPFGAPSTSSRCRKIEPNPACGGSSHHGAMLCWTAVRHEASTFQGINQREDLGIIQSPKRQCAPKCCVCGHSISWEHTRTQSFHSPTIATRITRSRGKEMSSMPPHL